MIVAISRFAVKNGKEAEVRAAFEARPRKVESVPGFLGLEVFQRDAGFHLLTRWVDEVSFRAWHDGASHHASHALIPAGLKLDPTQTQLVIAERIDGAGSGAREGDLVSDLLLLIAPMTLARAVRARFTTLPIVIGGRAVHGTNALAAEIGVDIDTLGDRIAFRGYRIGSGAP